MRYISFFLITLASAQMYFPNFDKLHSYPSSPRKICIAFRAYTYTNSPWIYDSKTPVPLTAPCVINNSSISIPNWDVDGDPTTFSNTEKALIISTWAMVSELFASFDIDVTTECTKDDIVRYNVSDYTYGCKAQITNYASVYGSVDYFSFKTNGVSRNNSFGELSSNESNVWIFTDYDRGGPVPLVMAATIAHECGHTFGLSHDGVNNASLPFTEQVYYRGQGTGMTEWAPIMGFNIYSNNTKIRTRSMWNNGDYNLANNKEDDIYIISNKTFYKTDDVGNTCGGATALYYNGNISIFNGTIERPNDIDKFTIQLTANITSYFSISITPFQTPITDLVNTYVTPFLNQPNPMGVTGVSSFQNPPLDVQLQILNPVCGVIVNPTTGNPSDDLSVPKFAYTPTVSGRYNLAVSTVSRGDPLVDGYSTYGLIGSYTLIIDYNQTILTTPYPIPTTSTPQPTTTSTPIVTTSTQPANTTTPPPDQPIQPDQQAQTITPMQPTDTSSTPIIIAVVTILGVIILIFYFRNCMPHHKITKVQYKTHTQSIFVFNVPHYLPVQEDIIS